MKRAIIGVCMVLSLSAFGVAQAPQDKPAAPVLTETVKQRIVIAVQQVEIWQLRAQHAQAELAKATESAQRDIAAACGETFTLNLQTMACEPKSVK